MGFSVIGAALLLYRMPVDNEGAAIQPPRDVASN
jgi:hypothetical protein